MDSTSDSDLSEMDLYPNPSDGCVGIKGIPNGVVPLSIKIFDLSGQLLVEKPISEYDFSSEITFSNLQGLYLYSIKTNVGIIKSGKVVFN